MRASLLAVAVALIVALPRPTAAWVVVRAPVYYAPRPVYYAPPPVYVTPPPVYSPRRSSSRRRPLVLRPP